MGYGLPSSNLCISLCSMTSITTEIAAAKKSAAGPANMSPSIPKNLGNIIINGIKHSNCLVIPRKVPFAGFPMEVKKFDESG